MSDAGLVKSWGWICLMAGSLAQPLVAAEPGAISRAVEVPPPKGWTADTPLFQEEATTTVRDEAPITQPRAPARRVTERVEGRSANRPASVRADGGKRTRSLVAKEGARGRATAERKPRDPRGKAAQVTPVTKSGRAAAPAGKAKSKVKAKAPVAVRTAQAKERGATTKGVRGGSASTRLLRSSSTQAVARGGAATEMPSKARKVAGKRATLARSAKQPTRPVARRATSRAAKKG